MGGDVRAVEVRSGAPCYLTKKSPSSLHCYRFSAPLLVGGFVIFTFGLEPSLAVGSTRAGQGEVSKGSGTPLGVIVWRAL